MVRAAPSKDVPFNISANVPISSSATIASPIPPPTTPKPVFDIFLPKFAKLKDLPAFLAARLFLAKSFATKAVSSIPLIADLPYFLTISFCLVSNWFATWLPYLAPFKKPYTPIGATCAKARVILPLALASASSSKGLRSSKNFSVDAAVLVSKPKSTSSAPNDTKPLGIFQSPV